VCHGFAGYFDAQLYGDVTLSIHPPTHTPDMFSWFPILFPLQTPVHLAAGEVGESDLWVKP
jgi:type II protein arginine methyltransferase